MYRILALFAILELTVAFSNSFIFYTTDDRYTSLNSLFDLRYRRGNFQGMLFDGSTSFNVFLNGKGEVVSCARRKTDFNDMIPLMYIRSGTIDELIAFFLDRGVKVDNLITITNLENLKQTCLGIIANRRTNGNRRTKRNTQPQQSTMFIYPGTKWCGKGNIARNWSDLGDNFETDSCCRDHDSCKGSIVSRSKKFNYYNDSPFTINSCRCDEDFKTCLQSARTTASNNVGELFFNRVGMRCYRLRYRRQCVEKQGFWNTCVRYETVMEAYPVQLPRWVRSIAEAEDY